MTLAGKLNWMLNRRERWEAVTLLILMLSGVVLETLGIGLIIPALSLMTEPDIARKYPALIPWLARLGNPTPKQLVIGGMLSLVFVNAVKAVFLAFLAWRQSRFVFGLQATLSSRFFAGYLNQPYTFHLQRNSSQLIQTVTAAMAAFVGGIISASILVTEFLALATVAILLLIVEPVGAIFVMAMLGIVGYGFSRITKRRVESWGEAWRHHENSRMKHLQEGLGGAKDVKVLGREAHFLDQYATHSEGVARMSMRSTTIQAYPRLLLELMAVVCLAAVSFVVLAQGKPIAALVPTLGLFAAAAFRLLPSTNRLLTNVQALRFSLPIMDTLYNELRELELTQRVPRTKLLPFERDLSLRNVTFTYENAARPALRDATVVIPRGTSVGFVGGSGAGKTTLIDIVLGLLAPGSGAVEVDGVDIRTNMRGWQDQIGYVPQSIYLTDDTLRRNVAFGIAPPDIDENAVKTAIVAAQLDEFVASLPEGLNTVVGERGVRLSGGQRQRIGIARALYHDPSVLVLDEATSALDTFTEQGVTRSVAALQGKKTILIVAHRLSTVANCDVLYRLEGGRVVAKGSFAEIALEYVPPDEEPLTEIGIGASPERV